MSDTKEIGKRIKARREEIGLTQEMLGSILHLNKSTIQRYESGKIERIKLPVLESIAHALEVNPEYLALKTNDPIDYNADNYNIDAPLDVIRHFKGNPKKIADHQKTVREDAEKEFWIDNELYHYFPITYREESIIDKYRCLDEHSRQLIDMIIDKEYEICNGRRQ